ncbi:hypothetical protein AAC387_Pa04g0960 [Persea americana]
MKLFTIVVVASNLGRIHERMKISKPDMKEALIDSKEAFAKNLHSGVFGWFTRNPVHTAVTPEAEIDVAHNATFTPLLKVSS